jgi:hypothetical protein
MTDSKTNHMNDLFAQWDAVASGPVLPDTTTENGMAAHSSTGSACLDFFASVVRDTPSAKVVDLFRTAYLENPYLALQILMNLRDCIGDGKQEKRVSFDALAFLKTWKPRTYLKNLKGFTDVGCYKDLLVLDSMCRHPLVADPELKLMAAALKMNKAILDARLVQPMIGGGGAAAPAQVKESLNLSPKWAPTEGCKDDKNMKAAERLAAILGVSKRDYRVEYLTPQRREVDVLERHQSLGTWDKIYLPGVPATAARKQKKAFMKHLPEKYTAYLAAVQAGKSKMNSKGIQPHELVRTYLKYGAVSPVDAAVDAQWKALEDRLAAAGAFEGCTPICDVSGSMSGVPMEVSIAMGILVSSLSKGRFKNRVITFSAVPQWHTIVGETLGKKVSSLSRAAWEMNTDFIAVFKMLLTEATTYGLTPEQMPKKILVFTDMQFDAATDAGSYKTAHAEVVSMYTAAGYTVPDIVFWNLRDTKTSFPVRKDTPGVALMSGFSAEMLKLLMDNAPMTPYSMMLRAVSKYEVVVVDE